MGRICPHRGSKGKIAEMQPILSELELTAALRETKEAAHMVEIFGNPPAVSMNGLEMLVEGAELKLDDN